MCGFLIPKLLWLQAQVFPVAGSFESYNRELKGKYTYKQERPKLALYDGPNARPLYNSNMTKVCIVKWFQNYFFVDRNALKTVFFLSVWCARNDTSVNKNLFLRPHNYGYFCHIAIRMISE